jgi:nitroreductase
MEFQEVVRKRRMVRNFQARPVPAEILDRILANATRAPSAGFSQGWAFLVLEGSEQTATFWSVAFPERRESPWPGVYRAPVIIVALAHARAYLDRYAEPDKAALGRRRIEDWPAPYWHIDTGFAVLLMLLTAVDAGLGAFFFSVRDIPAFRAAFGVPGEYLPIGAVALGYPAPDRPSASLRRGRRPVSEVVHRGAWRPPKRDGSG